jgi:hypothetical protein
MTTPLKDHEDQQLLLEALRQNKDLMEPGEFEAICARITAKCEAIMSRENKTIERR